MARLGDKLVEVSALHGQQPVGDAMQGRIRRGIVADALVRALGMAEIPFKASIMQSTA